MKPTRRTLLISLGALACWTSQALGTVRETPYALLLDAAVTKLQPNELNELPFTLELMPGSRLGNLRVANLTQFQQSDFTVEAGKTASSRRLTLHGTPLAHTATVEFELEVDGQLYVEHVDFSDLTPGELTAWDGTPIVDAVDIAMAASLWKPQPMLVVERSSDSANKYNIHAYGRLVYWRPGGSGSTTNVLVGVDGAEVHLIDEDGFDNTLATTVTDVNGYFDINVSWGGDLFDNEPDLTIKFDSGNSSTQVGPNSITTRYNWRTPVRENFTGSELNIGTYVVSGMRTQPLHILTTLTRAYRWYQSAGISLPGTAVHWPDADWSYYTSWNNTLHILPAHAYAEQVLLHELGHHYVNHFSSSTGPDYCNDICDKPDDCGHCGWCEENGNDAWGEGFPNFIAFASEQDFQALYAPAPVSYDPSRYEFYAACDSNGLDEAALTENALAAVLRDLYDDDADSDTAWTTGLRDEIQMPYSELLDLSQSFGGTSAVSYLAAVRTFLQTSPSYDAEDVSRYWAVTQMNGFDLDTTAPTMPTGVASATHTVGVSSPSNFPYLYWTASTDAHSGVDHYLVSISSGGPGTPTIVVGGTNYSQPTPLAPGNYWFNVRAVDHAGRQSAVNSLFGPMVIAAPTALDFEPFHEEFWYAPAMPTAGTTSGTPTLPATLNGGVYNTYAQFAFRNTSPSGFVLPTWYTTVEIDGTELALRTNPAQTITGFETFWNFNIGPMNVRGGRHLFVCTADGRYGLAESGESDNWNGQQYVWTPQSLAANTPVAFTAPRSRTGGFNKVAATFFNGDGHRFTQTGWWNALTLETSGEVSDYSLSLHNPSGGSTDGFTTALGFSGRPAGGVEVVLTNRNNVGGAATQFDVGVYNTNLGTSNYTVEHITSTTESYGSSFAVSFGSADRLALKEFYVSAPNVGPLSPQIQLSDPAEGPVYMVLLDDDFTTGDIYDYAAIALTDETGFAQLDLNLSEAGYYCLVFLRDAPASVAKRGALEILVELAPTLANLRPYEAAGWFAPLVPRPANDGTPGSVPAPASLVGGAPTYINFAFLNDAVVELASAPQVQLDRDGQPLFWATPFSYGAGVPVLWNASSPYTIPGGRHTLSLYCDSPSALTESDESDNGYGVQWVWAPPLLAAGPATSQPAPRDPFGGVELIDVVVEVETAESGLDGGGVSISPLIWPNCDGFRTPSWSPLGNDGWWAGFAIMSQNASNAELRLHAPSSGPTNGFAEDLVQSNWGVGHSDFVFANFNAAPTGPYDGGVIRSEGNQPYDIQVVASTYLATNPHGSYGPFALDASHIVNLHEVYLEQGVYVISLENETPGTRLGVSLYGPRNEMGQPFFGKSDLFAPNAASWITDGGPLEYLTVQIPQGGADYHCLAVWKVGPADLPDAASYSVNIYGGATPVDEALPVVSALRSIYPNPFNPRTTVGYELGEAADVMIELFDVRGTRVRRLTLGRQSAGRHTWALDGVDQNGASLASGRYIVQLVIGQERHRKSVTLLK